MNLFKLLLKKIKIDWQEYKNYRISLWNVMRDKRLTKRAINRARIKNSQNGKTYYILRDRFGGINELTKEELAFFTRIGYFKKMNYLERLKESIAIITSDPIIRDQYTQVQLKKESK